MTVEFLERDWVAQVQALCVVSFLVICFAQAFFFKERSYRHVSNTLTYFTKDRIPESKLPLLTTSSSPTTRPSIQTPIFTDSLHSTFQTIPEIHPAQIVRKQGLPSDLYSNIPYNPHGKYGFGLCAGKHHDQLAWSQIRYLQHFFPDRTIDFLVCHVGNELRGDQITRLEALPRTKVLDLAIDRPEATDFARGYPCKPLCMLQMNQELIAIGDVDAVYFLDPFDSVDSSTFAETGSMFLHDYRIFKHKSKYNYVVEHHKHVAFGKNPCWDGSGIPRDDHLDHIGESSLVILERERHKKTLRELAKLHQNVTKTKEMYTIFWGDKETYWLAAAVANATCGWSLWRNAVLGEAFERDGINGICEKDKTYVQYQPFVKESPQISHVNGKAVKWFLNGEDIEFACCVSSPLLYTEDPRVPSTKGCRIWQDPPMESIPPTFISSIQWRRDILKELPP